MALWCGVRASIELQSHILLQVTFCGAALLAARRLRLGYRSVSCLQTVYKQALIVIVVSVFIELFCVIPLLSLKEIKKRALQQGRVLQKNRELRVVAQTFTPEPPFAHTGIKAFANLRSPRFMNLGQPARIFVRDAF